MISKNVKIALVFTAIIISFYCFLIKLPLPLRKMDTELHALFYFSAAAFLNILFCVKKLNTHFLIFGMLFLFSALIEFAQEFFNTLVKKRIHGNFDPVDLKYNLVGLILFSLVWFIYFLTSIPINNIRTNE
jgi:glucan phosphoethanolaminetransferase (alkaline phosphatase superfamily)